jgi:hypothetical protein
MPNKKPTPVKSLSAQASIEIDRPLKEVYEWVLFTPLEIQLPGTDKLPGVAGTETLNGIKPGYAGHRRRVNLNDGTSAIEEISHTDNADSDGPLHFEYTVRDYTLPIARNIELATGQWRFEQNGSGTRIQWRYSFTLFRDKPLGRLGGPGRFLFNRFFVRTSFYDWMVATLAKLKQDLEGSKDPASP